MSEETLPFDVERERLPAWVQAASGGVILASALVALKLLPMLVVMPFLVASSVGRRFASSATHVEIDRETVALGDRSIRRSDIIDVWRDSEDARVTLAIGEQTELVVLYFENAGQARRFASALDDDDRRATVGGHRPRPIDALSSARFLALSAAFFATGAAWLSLIPLAFFALGAMAFVRAKQIVVKDRAVEVRTAVGETTYAKITSVDEDAGTFTVEGGSTVSVTLRDTLLGSPAWLGRARQRVLTCIARQSTDDTSRSA